MPCLRMAALSGVNLWEKYVTGRVKNLLRLSILLFCSIMVVIQLSECFTKLIWPPITTNTRIQLNETMTYPALTVCRRPPYKAQVVEKHHLGAEIRWTSEWANFPFENTTLTEFWNEATYSRAEVLVNYALNYRAKNVNVTSSTFFLSGLCHTLQPLVETQDASKDVGLSVFLRHSTDEVDNPPVDVVLGWDVYIHDANNKWTEPRLQTSGRQEVLFLEVGENLEVKIGVQDFRRINDKCNHDPAQSFIKCEDLCHWQQLVDEVGCGAPWLMGINATDCNTYESVKSLIIGYLNTKCPGKCCGCKSPCRTQQYISYVVNRTPFNKYVSKLNVFFSSKLVTMIEEHITYDWSQFISDMGGSMGFLLGLSVLGIIDIVDRIINKYIRKPPTKQDSESDTVAVTGSKF